MTKRTARAGGLALALFFFRHVPAKLSVIMHLADRFTDYIFDGQWPREAVDQLGSQNANAPMVSTNPPWEEEDGKEKGYG